MIANEMGTKLYYILHKISCQMKADNPRSLFRQTYLGLVEIWDRLYRAGKS